MNFQLSSLPCAIMALLAWTSSSALPSPPSLDNVPAGAQALKFSGDPVLKELETFLKQGDLVRFYQTVRPYVGKLDWSSAEKALTGDMLNKQMLINRLVAAAPLFELHENTPPEQLNQACVYEHDLNLKGDAMNDLYVISKINLKQNRSLVQKKETAQLCSLYAAMMIRSMKDHYIPGFQEKKQEIKRRKMEAWKKAFYAKWKGFYEERDKELNRDWKESLELKSEEEQARYRALLEKGRQFKIAARQEEDKRRNWANMLGVIDTRNSSIEKFFCRRNKALLLMLLDNYPGKSSEVFKYLKLAGYREDEMMEVVDQIEGRNKKTEFLYKSTLGRKFLKDKQEQEKSSTESSDK